MFVKPLILGVAFFALPLFPDGTFYEPPRASWALVDVLYTNFAASSVPKYQVIAKGIDPEPKISSGILFPGGGHQASFRLSSGFQGSLIQAWSEASLPRDLVLPSLPAGAYTLTAKSFDQDASLRERRFLQFYVFENRGKPSPLQTMPVTHGEMIMEVGDDSLQFSGLPTSMTNLSLEIHLRSIRFQILETKKLQVPDKSASLTVPIEKILPGQTRLVSASLFQGARKLDEALFLKSVDGVYPSVHGITEGPPSPGASSESFFETTETLVPFFPLSQDGKAVNQFLDGFVKRGSSGIKFLSIWNHIQPQGAAFDFSQLDEYIALLVKRKISFRISLGGAIFGGNPIDTWGEWMMNQKGSFELWRGGIPVVSPASPKYWAAAARVIEGVSRRYGGLSLFKGYVFMSQGADSFVFHDHYDVVTDYSPWARSAFRDFLKGRQPSLAELNQVWGSSFRSWDAVEPPLPDYGKAVDLSPAWISWNDYKLQLYKEASIGFFNRVVRGGDSQREIVHLAAYTGPIETLAAEHVKSRSSSADGGGEDSSLIRILNVNAHYGLPHSTESHFVPASKITHFRDLVVNALRNGLHGKHINLVWNSYVSAYVDKMEKNWDQVADTMKWWTDLVPTLKSLGATRAVTSRVGAVLSWPDMYYRTRAYRWYAMPGRSMDENLRQAGVFPVEWVSGLTLSAIYDGLDLVFASPDALVWDKELCLKLKDFVDRGGKLVILGNSGQYMMGEKNEYVGPSLLGRPALPGTVGFQEWTLGKGKVAWLPGALENLSNVYKTVVQNREPVAAALKWAGFQPKVVSSNPKIEVFLLTDGKKEFLIASHYLGQVAIRNKFDVKKEKPDLETTQVRLNLSSPQTKIRFKLLAGPAPLETETKTVEEWSKKGLSLGLLSTEFSILEIEKP